MPSVGVKLLENSKTSSSHTWHVNVDGHDSIAAAHHRVGVVVVAAAVGARAHRDDPFGRGHLIVDLAEGRRHLIGQRARHNYAVGLTRTGAEHHAVSVHVVAGRRDVHHLHGAASQAESHWPQRALLQQQQKY